MSWKPRADREATMSMIKDDLLRWSCERHATDCPFDRRLLRDKAVELASEYGVTGTYPQKSSAWGYNFKCSERWLTCFLRKHGFSLNPDNLSGPIFNDYRLWIDVMRPVITRYKYRDLFHLDELTMYADLSPDEISSVVHRRAQRSVPDASLKRTTILLCCNASGTEKLPLLICGSYPASIVRKDYEYSHNDDAVISDELFRGWLGRLDDRMLRDDRKILLLLHRNRTSALRGLKLSNVEYIFFPNNFPPLLRPLTRDVFHFVKMIYRSKYVEGIGEHGHQWNVENAVKSLAEAWRKLPRALIITSFQRTNFRTDDCFLEIYCHAWEGLKTGMSFKNFVTFDDDLTTDALHDSRKLDKTHNYNLRAKEVRPVNDYLDPAIDSREKISSNGTDDQLQGNGNSRKICAKADVDSMKKGLLKRPYDKALLVEDYREETRLNKNSIISLNNVPPSIKLPRVASVERIDAARKGKDVLRSEKSERTDSSRVAASAASTSSRTNPDCASKLTNKTSDCEKRRENSRASSDERSVVPSPRIDEANRMNAASRPAFEDTSIVDTDARESNAGVSCGITPKNETESIYQAMKMNGNGGQPLRESLKRRRSYSVKEPLDSDNESERKRRRSGSDWTKQYETTFVFGSSDDARIAPGVPADLLAGDDTPFKVRNDVQLKPRRSCETEKSIFTIRPRKD